MGMGCPGVLNRGRSQIQSSDFATGLQPGDCIMANDKAHPNATEMDYPAHERNYSGFIKLFKWGTLATAIIAAVVIYIIAN